MTAPELQQVPVYQIPLLQIAVHDRARKKLNGIEELAKDIEANGQLQAGVVRRATESDEDEGIDPAITPYVLVAGGRRYAACFTLGLEFFKAELMEDMPPLRQKICELAENLNREELDWYDQAELRRQIHALRQQEAAAKGESWSLQDTALQYGFSHPTLVKDIAIAEAVAADPQLKDAGSKKAAERVVAFREHVRRQEAVLAENLSGASLRSLVACEDARSWLRKQPTGSVDLTLTDTPWGIDYHSTGSKNPRDAGGVSDYDDSEAVTLDLLVDVVPEIIRTTREAGWIVCFMAESNLAFLRDLFESCCSAHYQYGKITYEQDEWGEWTKRLPTACGFLPGTADSEVNCVASCCFLRAEVPSWIWFRPNSHNPGRFPELHAKNFYEPILVFNRGAGRLYKHQDDCPNVLVFDADYGDERIHSNQKPRALGAEIIQRTTLTGAIVCDPFAGSGNFLAAASEYNRSPRGCELNSLTYDLALGNIGRFYVP